VLNVLSPKHARKATQRDVQLQAQADSRPKNPKPEKAGRARSASTDDEHALTTWSGTQKNPVMPLWKSIEILGPDHEIGVPANTGEHQTKAQPAAAYRIKDHSFDAILDHHKSRGVLANVGDDANDIAQDDVPTVRFKSRNEAQRERVESASRVARWKLGELCAQLVRNAFGHSVTTALFTARRRSNAGDAAAPPPPLLADAAALERFLANLLHLDGAAAARVAGGSWSSFGGDGGGGEPAEEALGALGLPRAADLMGKYGDLYSVDARRHTNNANGGGGGASTPNVRAGELGHSRARRAVTVRMTALRRSLVATQPMGGLAWLG